MRLFSKNKFTAAKLIEINDELRNPERGWYQIHTFKLGDEITMVDREYTLNNTDSVAFILIDISDFKNRPLDNDAIAKLRMIFDFFKDYRLDMIVRIVYDTVGKCMETEPSNEELIVEHMKQIGRVLKAYAPEIYVYQGLLIGNWGEMHSSKFLSPARLRRLSESFLLALKDTAYLAVRRPSYVRILFPEGEDLRQHEVGLFDDAIMASPTHLGTFGDKPSSSVKRELSWHPGEELEYLSKLCDHVPYGGEALWPQEDDDLTPVRNSLKETVKYFKVLHISYLNRIHDVKFLDNLRSLTWNERDVFKGMNGYDYIGRHLGYRYVVKKVTCQPLADNPDILKWEMVIENVGFARAYFKAACYIQGQDEVGNEKKIDVSKWIDLTRLGGGEEQCFTCMTSLLYGNIFLNVVKASTKQAVYFANRSEVTGTNDSDLYLGQIKK